MSGCEGRVLRVTSDEDVKYVVQREHVAADEVGVPMRVGHTGHEVRGRPQRHQRVYGQQVVEVSAGSSRSRNVRGGAWVYVGEGDVCLPVTMRN